MLKWAIPGFLLLTLPLLANAQHGYAPAAVPSGMPAAPVHAFAMPAAPVHSGAAAPVHTVGHPSGAALPAPVHTAHAAAPGARPALPRGAGYPVAPRSPVRNRPILSSPFLNGAPLPASVSDAPGFGFDYAHFFAVHPNARFGRFPNGFFFPFIGGDLFIPYPSYVETAAPAEQAATATATEAPERAEEPMEGEPAPPAAVTPQSSTPKQQSEFVFVRRDGTLFFAVAYSFDDNNLRFITRDGLPKSVLLSSLDLAATRQFNEERGATVRLPY